ncbi:MAG TPA: LysR substrate-binding domain-containing protein [Candidatus Binatus sp.]|nr:LysR substrate-binding domain-containing protein [Candidatus Binatus sp.]
MELRHLRYFVAVAEELHFGRAAVRLRMAQPPLSHQIRQLEEEMGVALFHRTKRRVEITPAGQVFLEEVRHLFAQAELAVSRAQRANRGEIGKLGIGFVPSADLDILPRVLRTWGKRFPRVEIDLHALLAVAQVEALREDRIQVGFVRLPVDGGGLVIETIQQEPLMAVLPAGHRLARCARVRLADLAGDPMIMFPRRVASGYYDLLISACRGAGFTPQVLHEPGSIQTNLGLVSAKLGVTLMPASIRTLRRAGVVYRPLAPPVPQVEMALAYRRDDRSAVLPAFLQVVREVVRNRPAAS